MFIEMSGQRFGRLTVVERNGSYRGKKAIWRASCDCGGEISVIGVNLRNGHTQSCGCLKRDSARLVSLNNITHGEARLGRSHEYRTWTAIKNRCSNPTNPAYRNYGGRGIRVCERWENSFERFLADVGRCPPGLTLDREDNDGGYDPDNCRWATPLEQRHNRRDSPKYQQTKGRKR